MSFKISTTLLTMSCCTALGLSYCPQAQATSPNLSAQAVQQVRKVSGHVVDADGPIIGASIVEKGNPKNGAVTDLDGNFSLNVRPGATLVVSYIGYKTQEVIVGNQSDIAITLKNGGSAYDWNKYIDKDLLAAYQNGSNAGTDWLDALRNKNAVTTNHAINITGGSDRSKFSTGIGYQYQNGILGGQYAKSDFRRFTFRLNSEHFGKIVSSSVKIVLYNSKK